MSESIERRPRCQVIVGGGTAEHGTLASRREDGGAFFTATHDITAHVRRLRTAKFINSPAGTFELGLTFRGLDEIDRASLNQVLVPDNLVEIKLDAGLPSTTLQTVMRGWIISVRQKTTIGANGRPNREVVVTGQDSGKFLLRHELPGHLLTAFVMGEKEAGRRLELGLTFGGTVGQVLQGLFQRLLVNLLPSPVVLREGIRLLTDPDLGPPGTAGRSADALHSYVSLSSVWERNGKFWNLFRDYVDAPWNEAFGDYVDDPETRFPNYTSSAEFDEPSTPIAEIDALGGSTTRAPSAPGYHVVVRPQPFSKERWDRLPTTVVRDDELRLEDMRLGDDERINLVRVPTSGKHAASSDYYHDATVHQTVHFSKESADRHGTQGMSPATIYTDLDGGHQDAIAQRDIAAGRGEIAAAIRTRARRLWDWYSINDRLWKGAWVIAGNPNIRIGQRAANQSEASAFFTTMEYERRCYYVERVVQDYVDGSHFFTHLALTRGQPLGSYILANEPDPLLAP